MYHAKPTREPPRSGAVIQEAVSHLEVNQVEAKLKSLHAPCDGFLHAALGD